MAATSSAPNPSEEPERAAAAVEPMIRTVRIKRKRDEAPVPEIVIGGAIKRPSFARLSVKPTSAAAPPSAAAAPPPAASSGLGEIEAREERAPRRQRFRLVKTLPAAGHSPREALRASDALRSSSSDRQRISSSQRQRQARYQRVASSRGSEANDGTSLELERCTSLPPPSKLTPFGPPLPRSAPQSAPPRPPSPPHRWSGSGALGGGGHSWGESVPVEADAERQRMWDDAVAAAAAGDSRDSSPLVDYGGSYEVDVYELEEGGSDEEEEAPVTREAPEGETSRSEEASRCEEIWWEEPIEEEMLDDDETGSDGASSDSQVEMDYPDELSDGESESEGRYS